MMSLLAKTMVPYSFFFNLNHFNNPVINRNIHKNFNISLYILSLIFFIHLGLPLTFSDKFYQVEHLKHTLKLGNLNIILPGLWALKTV